MRVKKGAKAENGAPGPTVLLVDQQAPIADGCQIAENGLGELLILVEQCACLSMPADDLAGIIHHLGERRVGRFAAAAEQLGLDIGIPDGPVQRTVDGLVLRGEERFDLIIGAVDGAGPTRFVGALPTESQRRFGERVRLIRGIRIRLGWLEVRIHQFLRGLRGWYAITRRGEL